MAVTRTASLKSSAFFIIDGFYSVNNVICRKFSKDLINIKEKDKKVSLPHHSPKKKTRNTTNTKGIRTPLPHAKTLSHEVFGSANETNETNASAFKPGRGCFRFIRIIRRPKLFADPKT
jgi:hypothetical protein